MTLRKLLHAAAFFLALGWLAACERVPDDAQVRSAVQATLDAAFAEPVMEIASFSRMGSGPLPSEADGAARKIVYYHARLNMLRDYSFGDWESLNPTSLAQLLGAGEQGIEGIDRNGNEAGDTLLVRGSVGFEEVDDAWQPVVVVPEPVDQPPPADNTGPPAVARSLVDQIMALFEGPPAGTAEAARTIITQELDQAYRQITLRLDRLQRAFVIAGGPPGGEYDLVAGTLAGYGTQRGLRSTAVATDGSVENLQLIRDGSADVALAQNDIAAMAFEGVALFDRAGPDRDLRALASLFPEALHIVVRADSPIRTVDDLRGKRVDLGLPDSGSRLTALAVLAAHGLTPGDLASVADAGPGRAAQALATGEIDAIVSVINAPARLFQRLAARPGIRLVPLAERAITELAGGSDSLIPLTLPVGTYPRQTEAIPTVAVTALLVAREAMPEIEVTAILDTVFEEIDFLAAGSAAGALISRASATTGLSIPLHPAAEAYLAGTQAAAAP